MEKPRIEDEIICYCREGRRAQDATMSFLELGFRKVSKLQALFIVYSI